MRLVDPIETPRVEMGLRNYSIEDSVNEHSKKNIHPKIAYSGRKSQAGLPARLI
jgi:hypothetical protein